MKICVKGKANLKGMKESSPENKYRNYVPNVISSAQIPDVQTLVTGKKTKKYNKNDF